MQRARRPLFRQAFQQRAYAKCSPPGYKFAMISRLERISNVWFAAFVLPWIVIAIYVTCVLSIDPANLPWFHSEVGPVELVSALLFLPMCYFAGHVAYRLLNPRQGMSGAS